MTSKKFKLNKNDLSKILQVLGWTVASAVVAFLIDIIPNVEIGVNYAWLIPMINTGLVALKKFIQEKLS